jgi:hypothetical protein
MSLRIAFLISGEARNYIYTTFSFKKYVFNSCSDADMYISFKKNSRIKYLKEDIEKNISIEQQIPIDDIIKDERYLYGMFGDKLKYFGYDDENYIEQLIKSKIDSIDVNLREKISVSTIDQYARVKNIAEIFEVETNKTNKKYDIIIRLRLDKLWWVSKLEIEKYIKDKNKIYFSYIAWKKSKYNGLPNWIQDFFFMGNPELVLYVMKDFFEQMYNSKEYLKEHELNYAPELQLGNYVNSNSYLKNLIVLSNINNNLYALSVKRKLYLNGYFVGTYNDVNKSLSIFIKTLKQNQSYGLTG